ncbi:hypothetical protein [Streptomyces cyaneofuscatus]|uniref:hypothetical protein n=1 Tax=Streptomyces cyaneofuscatus TaxID=66883 RepID=UPI0036DC3770
MPEPGTSARISPHRIVPWEATTLTPRSEPAGGNGPALVQHTDRQGHADALVDGLEKARREATQSVQQTPEDRRPDGFAVRIGAARDHPLSLERLDASGLTLMSSHPQTENSQQDALVWIPFDKVALFTQRIADPSTASFAWTSSRISPRASSRPHRRPRRYASWTQE